MGLAEKLIVYEPYDGVYLAIWNILYEYPGYASLSPKILKQPVCGGIYNTRSSHWKFHHIAANSLIFLPVRTAWKLDMHITDRGIVGFLTLKLNITCVGITPKSIYIFLYNFTSNVPYFTMCLIFYPVSKLGNLNYVLSSIILQILLYTGSANTRVK